MALIYKCDYCGSKYIANQAMQFGITYIDDDKKEHPGSSNSPCHKCEEVAKKAYSERLERIKVDNGK